MKTNEIFGSRSIIEAINSDTQIEKVYILKEAENEKNNSEIDDQKRYLLNQKIDTLKSISTN